MGFGDDLLITALASKIKKQHPDRQIVVGSAEEKRAYHSLMYENSANISDCVYEVLQEIIFQLILLFELYVFILLQQFRGLHRCSLI